MALPIFTTPDRNFSQMQTVWAAQLNPMLNQAILKGNLLTDVPLVAGDNVINHLLGRSYQGYIITGMHNAAVTIYDVPSSFPNLNLTLHSSGTGSVDIYVF